ncbi:hypothetical protein BGX38DRAFT_74893 [Terfezia claveryi]|nr:hypothetical protein BGX38DRAFT_74893 [Terfezia claveryi]
MPQPKRKRASTNTHESDAEGDRDGSFVAEEEATEGAVSSTQGVPDGCPFMVDYRTAKKSKSKVKSAKKQRTGPTSNYGPPPLQHLDQEPPEDTTVYTVKPKTKWDSLKKYRNFVGASTFTANIIPCLRRELL